MHRLAYKRKKLATFEKSYFVMKSAIFKDNFNTKISEETFPKGVEGNGLSPQFVEPMVRWA